jgi:predicted aminopeptidase
LSADVSAVLKAAGRDDNHWLSDELNNARLLPMTLYEERVPAFRKLYADCDADLECFYRQAVTISELDEMERNTRLDALSQTISSGS